MPTGFSESGQTEANWFFAKKAGEGEIVISFQWGFVSEGRICPSMHLPPPFARCQSHQENSLESQNLTTSNLQRSKVKDKRTKARSQEGIPLFAMGLSLWKLTRSLFKCKLLLPSWPKYPKDSLLQFYSQQLWQDSSFRGSKGALVKAMRTKDRSQAYLNKSLQ